MEPFPNEETPAAGAPPRTASIVLIYIHTDIP